MHLLRWALLTLGFPFLFVFFFNDTATTEIYTLSLHDALPISLTNDEINRLLAPIIPETPSSLCDQAILELAYASGLRISELGNLRIEQLQLESGFINVIGKGNKERVVPLGRKAIEARSEEHTSE